MKVILVLISLCVSVLTGPNSSFLHVHTTHKATHSSMGNVSEDECDLEPLKERIVDSNYANQGEKDNISDFWNFINDRYKTRAQKVGKRVYKGVLPQKYKNLVEEEKEKIYENYPLMSLISAKTELNMRLCFIHLKNVPIFCSYF